MESQRDPTITLDELTHLAGAVGLDLMGWTPAGPASHGQEFRHWLELGFHGEMTYLADRWHERLHANHLSPTASSVLVFAVDYSPGKPSPGWTGADMGRFARYAWGDDYHDVIKRQLFALDTAIRATTERAERGKVCVDTAPLLERDFAAAAGLGFVGRNTCLIRPRLGSWTFLAALLVPENIVEGDSSGSLSGSGLRSNVRDWRIGTCGACTRCIDACPTGAIVSPYVLDARRCISYLTIELRGSIPRHLRPLMGNWVFGCDVCQEVCPYNRDIKRSARHVPVPSSLAVRHIDGGVVPLSELLCLGEKDFRTRFRKSSVWRAKRRGLVRNACVAAGNSRDPDFLPLLRSLLSDEEALIREHAAWAVGQIGGREAARVLEGARRTEADARVAAELEEALDPIRRDEFG